ncbi:MAG: DUF4340 domain-containing protein [Xanthomonadaceae bacterium]|nr:DUF4340 domain-containing protein [Rhodospirillaceae bacterium]NIA17765.1 DUF4340 domain-containing protein [Xanthomonadaceae bacterium]
MSIKRTYILAIIFILLLGTAYIIKTTPWANHGEMNKRLFTFDKNDVNKIEITNKKNKTILEKQDNLWLVRSANNFKANQTFIDSMIKTVLKIKDTILVSDNVKKQALYNVDKENGITVKIYNNDKILADFVIGKDGSSFNTNYFRIANSDKVYLSNINIKRDFSYPDYRDMNVLTLKKKNISKLEFNYKNNKKTFAIEKNKKEWKIVSSQKLCKQEAIDEILNTISNLVSQNIVRKDEKEKTGLNNPELKLSIFQDKDKKVLLVNAVEQKKNKEKKYYLQIEGDDNIYSVDGYLGDKLMKQKKDF